MTEPGNRPGLLICAGLDPSGGAGFIVDVRVAHELGTRPVGVVTTTTVQNTVGAISGHVTSADVLREQLEFLLSDVEVAAVKIGMIGSREVALAIAGALALTRAPVVWDPVLAASRGPLAMPADEFLRAAEALWPHVTLVTPNADELGVLTAGAPSREGTMSLEAATTAGLELAAKLGVSVLVKAGHLAGDSATDVLCHPGPARSSVQLPGERLPGGTSVHGTGCVLATAIAASLAHGAATEVACQEAKAYLNQRIAAPVLPGRGAPAVL